MAAFDNLVVLPKSTGETRPTIQPFIFFAPPVYTGQAAGLRPAQHVGCAAPKWSESDEQWFASSNFIYGESAIAEELSALPDSPSVRSAFPRLPVTIWGSPEVLFEGAEFSSFLGMTIGADRKQGIPCRVDPILGEVTADNVCEMLRRLEKALKIGPGSLDRRWAIIVCDADIRRHIANLIKTSNSHEFGWVRLQSAQWHASLCFRLTIGATWGEIFLFKMVEEVEEVTENTAAHISGGKRWRRSGNIALRVARGATRFLLQWYLEVANTGTPLTSSDFKAWALAIGRRNPYVAIILEYMRAVGLNLQLDDAVRRADSEVMMKLLLPFHWLAVSRGRNQYKEILADQIAVWALSNDEERDATEQATFAANLSGRFNTVDETYESMLKIVKGFLRNAQHSSVYASAINCTYTANVFTRVKQQLERDLHCMRAPSPSTRPTCIKTEAERRAVNAYAEKFAQWVPREATPAAPIKAFRTSAEFSIGLQLTLLDETVSMEMMHVFEDGRQESEAIIQALCNGDSVCWDNGDEWLSACRVGRSPALQNFAAPTPHLLSYPHLSPAPAAPAALPVAMEIDAETALVLATESPPPIAAAALALPSQHSLLSVSRRKAKPAVIRETPRHKAKVLKQELKDTQHQKDAATHQVAILTIKNRRLQKMAIQKDELLSLSKAELTDILKETGGKPRKKDNWEDLAEKVCNPNPIEIEKPPQTAKKARHAEDEDETSLLVQRAKSARGRTLTPSSRTRDLEGGE